MSKEQIIIGIDVGTSLIRTVIAQKQRNKSKPLILGVGTSPSKGISKGIVVDMEEAVSSISQSKEAAEITAGVPIEHAYVSINGTHVSSQFSKGVVAVSRANGEIGEEDINRAINAAQAVSMPSNKEIIDVIPCSYTIDGQEQIRDPLGMNGVRLEVKVLIIEGKVPFVKNLTKCVQRCGIDVDDLVFAPLAASRAVLSRRQKELGVVLVDIGKETTGLSVFEDRTILYSNVIPVGSGHITNDIALGLRTSIDVAEKVKLEYGTTLSKEVGKKDKIDISKIDRNEEGMFSRRYVAEIIEARVEEIFSMVDKELKTIDRSGMLPSGVVITGGGSKISGIITVAKDVLRLPAKFGFSDGLNGIIDRVDDPSFATVIGLVILESDEEGFFHRADSGLFRLQSLEKAGQKIRRIFRIFLP